ncbi:MAG: Fe-S-cluster-containing dehydrogenase component [Saprospiraceae bacterium]|jgi:Fe-S-cluster-containing dehydrogenase component/formate-dependent nitrite reductase membrane component NrfD
MKYGFVIDNRKCIGCHACTTACKSEHQVPVGVNRTWVKQVEKGEFPNTRRLFSVMRCNHCTDAPCVEICPVEALFFRDDGIVDFDKDRCIGCKSCMQACPYDALYIDPETSTAAKCNYCAHRVDIGLEPACVNVCPEHAIISGDMEDPNSEIAELLSRQQVKVRKPEKGTVPNLFYIDADDASLNPTATEKSDSYLHSSQSWGVGHYAKEAEKLAFSNGDLVQALLEVSKQSATAGEITESGAAKSIDLLMGKPRRAYDVADKGILWGWEVSAYVWTKAIAAGAFLVPFLAWAFGFAEVNPTAQWAGLGIGLLFLTLTGIFLIMDLDRPDRFLNVLFRPQWNSWLVKGGYSITIYGGLLTFLGIATWFGWKGIEAPVMWLTAVIAVIVAIYTAFLFAQAKGRDFWQSPTLSIHMLVHSFMAGAAIFGILSLFVENGTNWLPFLRNVMIIGLVVNLFTMMIELVTTHPTEDAKRTVDMIVKGRYKNKFWFGVLAFGNIIPLLILFFGGSGTVMLATAGTILLIGIYITEDIWVEAPQRIPLS